jgi:hypothetical protein
MPRKRTSPRVRIYQPRRSKGSILNEAQVFDIRCRLEEGEKGKDLAERYHVSRATISDIKHNRTWNPDTKKAPTYSQYEEEYIPGQGDPDA